MIRLLCAGRWQVCGCYGDEIDWSAPIKELYFIRNSVAVICSSLPFMPPCFIASRQFHSSYSSCHQRLIAILLNFSSPGNSILDLERFKNVENFKFVTIRNNRKQCKLNSEISKRKKSAFRGEEKSLKLRSSKANVWKGHSVINAVFGKSYLKKGKTA